MLFNKINTYKASAFHWTFKHNIARDLEVLRKQGFSYSLSELEAQDLETQELSHSQTNKKQLNNLEKKNPLNTQSLSLLISRLETGVMTMGMAKALFYQWATMDLKYHVRLPSDWDASHFKTPLAPNLTGFCFSHLQWSYLRHQQTTCFLRYCSFVCKSWEWDSI